MLFGYQYGLPGKKLVFMGAELAQRTEWNHDAPLDWELLDDPRHEGMRTWLAHLNSVHRSEPALHERDVEPDGFEWVDAGDSAASVISFLRWPARDRAAWPRDDGTGSAGPDDEQRSPRPVLVVANFTPVPRRDYAIGVPSGGRWVELANSDASVHGGSGWGNLGGVDAVEAPMHGRPFQLPLVLPPLAVVFLAPESG
jgi:1,4-alpha-glucan branching enzyme